MACVQFFGPEAGNSVSGEEFNLLSGGASIQTSNTRRGAFSLKLLPVTTGTAVGQLALWSTAGVQNLTTGLGATIWITYYLYIVALPSSSEEILQVLNTANAMHAAVRMTSTGTLDFYNAANSLVVSGTTTLSLNTWYRIDVKVGTSATVAPYEVRINKVSEYSGTAALTATNPGGVNFGKTTNRNGSGYEIYVRDGYIDDAAYIVGEQQTTGFSPAANGAAQTATIGAGSGSHFQIVNEAPADHDTSYLLTDAVIGDAETEKISATASSVITGVVNSVLAFTLLKRDSGTTNGTCNIRLRSGSTNSDTVSGTAGSSYSARAKLHNTDPATTVAWVNTGLNNLEVGYVEQQSNASRKSRMTQAMIMVNWTPQAIVPYLPKSPQVITKRRSLV
jgi:hypothetical protein